MTGVETRYARAADGSHVAYQVMGSGPLDLVFVGDGTMISIDMHDEEPHVRRFMGRLASFSRLIRFDRRGIGLSDRLPAGIFPSLELEVADLVSVLDAAGSERASLLAFDSAGMTALMAAAQHAERVTSLVLMHCYARLPQSDDYRFGVPQHVLDRFVESVVDVSRTSTPGDDVDDVRMMVSSVSDDPRFRQWWSRASRQGASPAAARANLVASFETDVRVALPLVHAPVLVLQRRDGLYDVGHAHYLAEHLPDARLVELPAGDHLPYGRDSDAVVDEIEEFLTGVRGGSGTDRVLTTVMFTDIVGSTQRAATAGDRSWHDVLDRHDTMAREELRRFNGREVKTTGDGIMATFDGPARAIRCAEAICRGARELGIEVRAGLHTGEVEVRGNDIGGIAVHLAQRVSGQAEPNQVLVSRTVVDLVAGSGIAFEDRGQHELKGLEGSWQLFVVVTP
jgi:class 3 adenylate cyclase